VRDDDAGTFRHRLRQGDDLYRAFDVAGRRLGGCETGEGLAEFLSETWVLEYQRALHIGGAVQTAGQFEMAMANGPGGFEQAQ
jgi:hypothetical protein